MKSNILHLHTHEKFYPWTTYSYFVNGSIPRYREISIRLPNLIIHQHVKIYLLTLFIRELAPLFTIIFIAYQIPSSRQIFEHLFVFFPAIEFWSELDSATFMFATDQGYVVERLVGYGLNISGEPVLLIQIFILLL